MDIRTFLSLPYHKQCELLWEEGQFVDSVVFNQFKANLYAVSNFFVEIICQPESTTVEKIQVATDEIPSKYLRAVDLSSLF